MNNYVTDERPALVSRPADPDFLLGRERELRVIEERLDSVSDRGSALLFRGEPGVGKTAILEAGKSRAALREMSVLAATGVPSETNLPFAGLYELLRPIIERTGRLPGPQQDALRAAFGLADVPAAELFLIALGALDLLSDFASEHALLLVAVAYFLSLLTNGKVKGDGLKPHSDLLADFPYLGPPHTVAVK